MTGKRDSTLGMSEGITGCWWRGVTLSAFRLKLPLQTCMSNFYARPSKSRPPKKLTDPVPKIPSGSLPKGPVGSSRFHSPFEIYLYKNFLGLYVKKEDSAPAAPWLRPCLSLGSNNDSCD